MAEIKLKTDRSEQAIVILREAMKTEELRIKYALDVAQKKLAEFEKKYGVSSETFINEWAAEDLDGRDTEYVREYIDARYKIEKVSYAYQYQDKENFLVCRRMFAPPLDRYRP
ncbi:MAG: hypothetical protein ACKVE3_02535 [Dissulfuribacterales bacterium]